MRRAALCTCSMRMITATLLLQQATVHELARPCPEAPRRRPPGPARAGHWKLGHTLRNMALMQAHLLLSFSLFAAVRTSPALFASFGFRDARPAVIAFMLFQFISAPLEEARAPRSHHSCRDRPLVRGRCSLAPLQAALPLAPTRVRPRAACGACAPTRRAGAGRCLRCS